MKHCKKCTMDKEEDSFFKNLANKDGLSSWCKKCTSKAQKERYELNKENISKKAAVRYANNKDKHKKKGKQWRYKKIYGIDYEIFEQMVEQQENKCFICNKDFISGSVSDAKAVLDHCHKTGKLRKILCNRCNSAMGWFEDNPELLEKAANYLRSYDEQS